MKDRGGSYWKGIAVAIPFFFFCPTRNAFPQGGKPTPADQQGDNDQTKPKKDDPKDADPIVLSTGSFQIETTDLLVRGRGMDFALTRHYSSGTTVDSDLGKKWNFNWNRYIALVPPSCPPGGGGNYQGPFDAQLVCLKTETICSTDVPKGFLIEPGSSVSSVLPISTVGTVQGIQVSLNISFYTATTVSATLKGPSGAWVQFLTNATSSTGTISGIFPVSDFGGSALTGEWILIVANVSGGIGTLNNWCLKPTYVPDDPACQEQSQAAQGGATPCSGTAYFYDGANRIDSFTCQNGVWQTPGGYFAKLIGQGTLTPPCSQQTLPQQFLLRDSDGTIEIFDVVGTSPYHTGKCYFLSQVIDRAGNAIRLTYEGGGQPRIKEIIDTLGRKITFAYDSAGLLESVTDFDGRSVRYVHDGLGNLVDVISPSVTGTSTGNDFPAGKTNRYVYGDPVANPELASSIVALIDANQVADGSLIPSLQNLYDSSGTRVVKQVYGGTDLNGLRPEEATY